MSRFSYRGDFSVAASVSDPLFWVLHGSFERMLQLMHFEGAMSSEFYEHPSKCAGHDANSTKTWLTGFALMDGTDAGKAQAERAASYSQSPLSRIRDAT